MPQFVCVEMEGAYPEDGVVLVEEEPGVADGVEVAYDVLVGAGVLPSTHITAILPDLLLATSATMTACPYFLPGRAG